MCVLPFTRMFPFAVNLIINIKLNIVFLQDFGLRHNTNAAAVINWIKFKFKCQQEPIREIKQHCDTTRGYRNSIWPSLTWTNPLILNSLVQKKNLDWGSDSSTLLEIIKQVGLSAVQKNIHQLIRKFETWQTV